MVLLDGYIRVSRVAGREGDAYHSPELQEDAIRRWAEGNGIELGEIVSEEDVSGGKAVDARKLGRLLKRIEAGQSDGLIVYETSRFGRDLLEVLKAHKRIKEAGARLVGVIDGVDTDQQYGKRILTQNALMAEEYLDQTRQRWRGSVDRAVGQGKHVACKAPLGYLRGDQVHPEYNAKGRLIRNARLVRDPARAADVVRAFEMRALEDASLQRVADHFGLSKTATASMLRNRAYLGEARGPNGITNTAAHAPLVSEELFAAVQQRWSEEVTPRNGRLSQDALLKGLIRCDGCGHLLRIVGTTTRDGTRRAMYSCARNYASGKCPAPANGLVSLVDEHVLLQVDVEGTADMLLAQEEAARAAKHRVEEAQSELRNFAMTASALDAGLFREALAARQEAVDEARADLFRLQSHLTDDHDQLFIKRDGKLIPVEAWGGNVARDRRRLRTIIADVRLRKADARRRWQPIHERVAISWVGTPS